MLGRLRLKWRQNPRPAYSHGGQLRPWWRDQMKTFSALLTICAGLSLVTDEFPAQRPVKRSFGFFYLRLNKRSSKQSWVWWFETPSRPLWRHCYGLTVGRLVYGYLLILGTIGFTTHSNFSFFTNCVMCTICNRGMFIDMRFVTVCLASRH